MLFKADPSCPFCTALLKFCWLPVRLFENRNESTLTAPPDCRRRLPVVPFVICRQGHNSFS